MKINPVLFNTLSPYTIKEGLSFWVNNSYRNYQAGITTVPEFIGEYMPQQTHFDSLFHLLTYKKEVIDRYLYTLREYWNEKVFTVWNRSNADTAPYNITFLGDIETGLDCVREWYISKEDFAFGNIDPDLDYSTVLKTLTLEDTSDTEAHLNVLSASAQCAVDEDMGIGTVYWATTTMVESATYDTITNTSTKTQSDKPPFLQNIKAVSGNKYQAEIKKMSTVQVGDVTKYTYNGFESDTLFNFSYALDKPFKVLIEIPIHSYKIQLKTKTKALVGSTLLDNQPPTCIVSGAFHFKDDLTTYSMTGVGWFETGRLSFEGGKVSTTNIEESKVVFLDKYTAKLLGGDDTVVYAELTKIQYLCCHMLYSTKTGGIGYHVHSGSIRILDSSSGYLKGSTKLTNNMCMGTTASYYYPDSWKFSDRSMQFDGHTWAHFRHAEQTSGSHKLSMWGTGRAYTVEGKEESRRLKCGDARNRPRTANQLTRYRQTFIHADKFWITKNRSKSAVFYTVNPIIEPEYFIKNIEINLSVYDHLLSIGNALLEHAQPTSALSVLD